MKYLFPLICFIVAVFSFSCHHTQPDPQREKFVADSILCAKYLNWEETVKSNLPDSSQLKPLKAPEHCFDSLHISEENPLHFCEPGELTLGSPGKSFFRYQRGGDRINTDFFFRPSTEDYDAYEGTLEQAERIRQFDEANFFCVFVENQKKSKSPILDSLGESFTPGKLEGWAIIVNFETSKPVAMYYVKAKSSENINFTSQKINGVPDKDNLVRQFDALIQINVDLWYNMEDAIKQKLTEDGAKTN
jgi:hypothetical protein